MLQANNDDETLGPKNLHNILDLNKNNEWMTIKSLSDLQILRELQDKPSRKIFSLGKCTLQFFIAIMQTKLHNATKMHHIMNWIIRIVVQLRQW